MASPSDASSRHDVVVIGAGPAGEAAAELGGSLGSSSTRFLLLLIGIGPKIALVPFLEATKSPGPGNGQA
jgi:hypothetical protein